MSQSPAKHSRIYIAGHNGLVGSALHRKLVDKGYTNVIVASKAELDLRDQSSVNRWFGDNKPEFVFLVAGKVGGIIANSTNPADFIYDNLMIHANVIEASRLNEVQKLLYLGSSCIYPREARQPISETELLAGPLEPTNQWYAIAKISGLKMCEAYRAQYGLNFISAMPTNLYGPGDNFDPESSHVIPGLIRRFHEAKIRGTGVVEIWGTGTPLREFLHVDDLASACLFLMDNYNDATHINVGSGAELSINELSTTIRDVVYPDCRVVFDHSKPDGTPRKLLDCTRIHALGWKPEIDLVNGLRATYEWFSRSAK